MSGELSDWQQQEIHKCPKCPFYKYNSYEARGKELWEITLYAFNGNKRLHREHAKDSQLSLVPLTLGGLAITFVPALFIEHFLI